MMQSTTTRHSRKMERWTFIEQCTSIQLYRSIRFTICFVPDVQKTTTLYLYVIGDWRRLFLQLLAGAGAVEIELSRQMESWGEKCAGLEQYAIKKFAHALETLPKCIAENGGVNVSIRITVKY